MKAPALALVAASLALFTACGGDVGLLPLADLQPADTASEGWGAAPEFLAARAICEWGWEWEFEVYLDDPDGLGDVVFVGVTIEQGGFFGSQVDALWLEQQADPHVWSAVVDDWDMGAECGASLVAVFDARDSSGNEAFTEVPIADTTF